MPKKRNSGKIFEQKFKESVEKNGYCLHRIKDAGDIGSYKTKKNVHNVADYIFYNYPNLYFCELKARSTNRINFSVLTEYQYDGLLQKQTYNGVTAGVVLMFLVSMKCYFIPIEIIRCLKDNGYKSVTPEHCNKFGIEIPVKTLRKSYSIDVSQIDKINKEKDWETTKEGIANENKG